MMIAFEFEGGVFMKGKTGHSSGKGFSQDCEKYNTAALFGWRVLRFTAPMVREGQLVKVLEKIGEQDDKKNKMGR